MPQKTKLVIVIPSLKCGGAENFVAQLCNSIDTNSFHVNLIVLNNNDTFYDIRANVTIVDLKLPRAATHIFTITAAIQRLKPNIVFVASNHVSLLLSIFSLLLPLKAKLVAWETSVPSANAKNVKNPKLYQWLLKKYLKKIPTIVCQSAAIQQDLIDNYGCTASKLPLVPTGVSIPNWQPADKVINLPKMFLTVARLSPEKGIADIIETLALFTEPFIYNIIGDGICRKDLEKLVSELQLQDKIFFWGAAPQPYLGFEEVDLFLMASYFEGLPTTLMEATSYGIPVVAFAAPGGISEVITHGLNGFIVPERSTQAYLAALTAALQHPFNRKTIRQNTIDKFDNQRSLQQLQDLFSNLAAQ